MRASRVNRSASIGVILGIVSKDVSRWTKYYRAGTFFMIQFYQFIPLISHLGGRMSFPGHSLRMETNRMATRTDLFVELERGVQAAMETYSNVDRGSGHFSMISTRLFEAAREIILEYLRLDKKRYVVVFCTPERAETLKTQL
jgi:hypothetical protein